MGLKLIIAGYIVGRNTKRKPGVPSMPLLTAHLRSRGQLEVTVDETEIQESYRETSYNLKVNDQYVGTYRVRQEGNIWSEIFLGRMGKVVRNVLINVGEDLGHDITNFEGTHLEDLSRLWNDYEKAGRYAFVLLAMRNNER